MRALLGRLLSALILMVGMTGLSLAQEDTGFDKDSDGQFTGLALITDDAKWYELFSRPEPPQISGKSSFGPGEEGSLALIFSNAEPKNGMAEIRCDITAFDPEGSRQVANDNICYKGPYHGRNILHPTLVDLRFAMGQDEPEGKAGFKITMRDVHSGRAVDLNVSFTQRAQP